MRLWRFADPGDFKYAQASRLGTWAGDSSRRVQPLVIEWEPGSNKVGDFVWPGFDTDIAITERVGKALIDARIEGFELAPVEMVDNLKEKRAPKKPRVTLPYGGPRLWDLWVVAWTELDRARSTAKVVSKQPDGTERYEVSGVERHEGIWDQNKLELIKKHHPRIAGHGIVVRTNAGIFRVAEFPGWIFCTDEVKQFIERHNFTNVSFLEMGDVSRT